jgi:hypothetical protein
MTPDLLLLIEEDYHRWLGQMRVRICDRTKNHVYDQADGRQRAAEDNRTLQHIEHVLAEIARERGRLNQTARLF